MILLDTHTFLWFILDDPQLSSKADLLISNPSNEIYISLNYSRRSPIILKSIAI
jgi:PIN domain nuclease of toxin-antitoxin system